MEIGIDDLDFEDDVIVDSPEGDQGEQEKPWMEDPYGNNNQDNQPSSEEYQEPSTADDDILMYYLRSKGIEDPSKIKFEDEKGEIEEKDWNSLDREEQLNILNSQETENDFSESELGLINKLRQAQLSPEEYEQYLMRQGAEHYASQIQENEKTYTIDDLTDEELFVMDLKSRIEDLTDEEAQLALDRALADENLFNRQMKGIRADYKRLEDEIEQRKQEELNQQQQEQMKEFSNSIINSIQAFNSLGSLNIEMTEDDMEDVAQFILTSDGAGINHFSKALNDPDTLVKMAWFTLKGEEAFNSITEYFKNEISKVSKASYEKGLKDGKINKLIYQPTNKQSIKQQSRQYTSIDDLD